MGINHMLTVLFILVLSSPLSDAKTTVRNLPGYNGDLPFSLETGYVGLGPNDEVQWFYYFVESQRDPSRDPLIIYLIGGPGTSVLYTFLFQIGPVSLNYANFTIDETLTLDVNPNSLTKMANVIFIDLPAGNGFAYATTYEASKCSDSLMAQQSYEFLIKWLEDHPMFLDNPLYVAGNSYAGIIIPIVTLEIYKGNERGDHPHPLNIKGYVSISPLTDKFSDFNSKFEFAHRLALISDDIYESAKSTCNGNYAYNDPANTECSNSLQRVDECTSRINEQNILDPYCDDVDPDPSCAEAVLEYLEYFGNDKEVQKALNVREGTIGKFIMTNESIHYRFKKPDSECYSYDIWSSVIYHKMLLSRNCQVLILSGDHDFTFPYVGAEQWIKSFDLPIESPWNPWFVNKQVAGYQMKYAKNEYSLTYATVKGAGHRIAIYKPQEVWVLLFEWLASQSRISDS